MTSTWPNAAQPGQPANPQESGPHWVDRGHGAEILHWDADEACWPTEARDITPDLAAFYWRYLRPVTHPREDAARDERRARLEAALRAVHRHARHQQGDRTLDQCMTALMHIDDLCRAALAPEDAHTSSREDG